MATLGNKKVFLTLAGFALLSTAICFGMPPETFGFELGNGQRVFVNQEGSYKMIIDKGWGVSTRGQFTEILAPLLSQYVPRTSLKINVAKAAEILEFSDLARKFAFKSGWKIGKIGKYHTIEKEAQLKEDRCMFDARIIKSPGEVTMISVDGGPDCREGSDFDRVKSSLDTFTLLE